MPGRQRAVSSGQSLQDRVEMVAQRLGLTTQREVSAARRLWGARRRIDIVVASTDRSKQLGIECKFQASSGTAEEKIIATVQDIAYWPIPGIVVIDGEGFSENMRSYLFSTGKVILFEELEDWLRLYFGL